MHKKKRQGSRYHGGPSSRYAPNSASQPRGGRRGGAAAVAKAERTSRFEGHGIPRAPRAMKSEARPAASAAAASPAASILTFANVKSCFLPLAQVGEGTYGKVYKAENIHTKRLIALKRLRLEQERDGFPITSIREIKLLQQLDHANISLIDEIIVSDKNAISMGFQYMANDLSGILMDRSISLTSSNIKHLTRQLFVGLQYLHQQQIIHRDIKGSNLLIDNFGNLKITDFGLAKKIDHTQAQPMSNTNRVITLWYRPPELLLGATDYRYEVDCWGCGCLLLELFSGQAVFQGTNEIDQFYKILHVLGTPSLDDWPQMFDMPWWFMLMPHVAQVYPNVLHDKFADVSPDALDLASKLLRYDQRKRYTAGEALAHPYFTNEPKPKPLLLGSDFQGSHEYEVKKLRRKEKEREKEKDKNV